MSPERESVDRVRDAGRESEGGGPGSDERPDAPPPVQGDSSGESGSRRSRDWSRAQSHVVGVSLMVGLTVLALGGLTVAIGTVVDSSASTAEANRVADAMGVVAEPGDVVGTAEAELRFGDGRLTTENRTIRVVDADNGTVIERVDSDVLVYDVGDWTVIGGNGAVLRASTGGATMVEAPSIVADPNATGPLLIGAPAIDAEDVSIDTDAAARVTLRATVAHDRRDLGTRRIRLAVETAYPEAWARYFEEQGATVIDRDRSFASDGPDAETSVVAEFSGPRQTYLIVHRTDLEVSP